jgi:hypothetical protein
VSTLRRKILASCGQVIAAVALFFIIGGHWGVLQTVAWANMIWTYSTQDGSVLAGAKKTFDGEHPCNMCDSIKEAKKQEKKAPEILSATKKIELFALQDVSLLPVPDSAPFQFPLPRNLTAESRPHSPAPPVPIA